MILIPKQPRVVPAALAAVLSALFAAGCATSAETGSEVQSSPILATTSIWADITSSVLCGKPVPSLIPIGSDPHTWEPSMATRTEVDSSRVIVANGLNLESGLYDILDEAEANGISVVELTNMVELLPTLANHDEHHDEEHSDEHDTEAHDDEEHGTEHDQEHSDEMHEHSDSGLDPHIWLDPRRVIDTIPAIVDIAVEAGFNRNEIEPCANAYVDSLHELDDEISALFESLLDSERTIVTNHDSLGYFADRYNLTVIGTVLPGADTSSEANAADLAALSDLINDAGVSTIFTDAESSDVDSRALAERLNIDIVQLLTASLTSGTDSGRSYLDLMRTNANTIHSALQHRG